MLGLFLLIVIVIIGSCIFDYFRFVIVDYTIKSNKVNKTLSIVVITDLHNKQFGHENRHLITKIKQINPDIICIAGEIGRAHV